MFWVYVLYSRKLDRLYVGQTMNLEKRLAEHRQGASFYTRRSDDWQLLYAEEFPSRGLALRGKTNSRREREEITCGVY